MPDSITQRDWGHLSDIVESARKAIEHLGQLGLEEFLADVRSQDAVIRRLTIMGEAAGRISKEFRVANPDLPWRSIIGMRNILVHNYDGVNLKVVWQVTRKNLPALIETLESFLDTIG